MLPSYKSNGVERFFLSALLSFPCTAQYQYHNLIAVEIVNHTHIKRQEVAFSLDILTNRELSIQNVPESNFIQ